MVRGAGVYEVGSGEACSRIREKGVPTDTEGERRGDGSESGEWHMSWTITADMARQRDGKADQHHKAHRRGWLSKGKERTLQQVHGANTAIRAKTTIIYQIINILSYSSMNCPQHSFNPVRFADALRP